MREFNDFLKIDKYKEPIPYPEYKYMMLVIPILINAKTIVETGLAKGHSTRIFLESLSKLSGERTLHTYEINREEWEKTETEIMILNFKAKWIVHWQECREGGKAWNGGKIDVLYLDSDHAYKTVTEELDAFSPWLSDKAVILTHDSWPSIGCVHDSYAQISKGHPGDTYWAMHDWGIKNGWKSILFTTPEGITILYRE